ncbi:hypothetical protein G7Z17_g10113 [Cylindrodendrum hubeiense]|uniref:N-acetyltransferase domain-containing protein n=1 Tax=Cylindrodendrum hubeiense TaxID=595255 RepID=A0A9P5LCM9_9HYPO|nr:hypothetical protein G7Z17_g10113 [Cylindrodendrum hubeiense]
MAAPTPAITVREATVDDVPAMVDAYFSAFNGNPLNDRCFPESSPDARAYWTNWIGGYIGVPGIHMLVALTSPPDLNPATPLPGAGTSASASDASRIVGWARWLRRPEPPSSTPAVATTSAIYPSNSEGALAADFFQTARDVSKRIVAGRNYWFLSMIVTRREAQRRGVGAALMRFGVERADEDGLIAYLNASKSGRPLYELFGFQVVEQSRFDELGLDMFHMIRDPKGLKGA